MSEGGFSSALHGQAFLHHSSSYGPAGFQHLVAGTHTGTMGSMEVHMQLAHLPGIHFCPTMTHLFQPRYCFLEWLGLPCQFFQEG